MQPSPSTDHDLRHARHNVRGRMNALKLCVSALEVIDSREELLEFLEMIDSATERVCTSLQELETAYDRSGETRE